METTFIAVKCGECHTMALTTNGEIYGWGSNHIGQLGLAHLETIFLPQKISIKNVKVVICGGFHTIFITENDDIYVCGFNTEGQLGLGHNNHPINTPCKLEFKF